MGYSRLRMSIYGMLEKDSTGICFIGERNFRNFLKEFLPAKQGDIVDKRTGKIVGKHEGVMYYTLGQRRGLGIGGYKDGNGESWFVVDKDVKKNILYVTQGEGKELFSNGCVVKDVNWIPEKPSATSFDCYAKLRYRQPEQKVHVTICDNGSIELQFYEPQRAVTPGQFAVLYSTGPLEDGYCLGGGVIDSVIFHASK